MSYDDHTPGNWRPSSITIKGTGTNNIDLMDCSTKRVVFPASIYPPQWESKAVIKSALIQAALVQANTQLIVNECRKPKGNKPGVLILTCSKYRYYQPPKKKKDGTVTGLTSTDIYANPLNADGTAQDPQYKENIRLDKLVNKASANRGTLGAGKKLSRRTQTQKPAPGLTCKLRFRLLLDPGCTWYVEHVKSEESLCHNHMRLEKGEMLRPKSTLEKNQKERCQTYAKYTNGGATSGLMSQECDGFRLTPMQCRDIGDSPEEDDTFPESPDEETGTSHANQLIVELKKQHHQKKLNYVALYHEVNDTTLVAITKAAEKEEKRRAAEVRNDAAEGMVALSQVTAPQQDDDDDDLLPLAHSLMLEVDSGGSSDFQFDLGTLEDQLSLGTFLEPVRDRLQVGQRILLAVAWCRTDEKRLFELFPEVLMFDVTFGTNYEHRPLGMTASPDGDMNVFTPVRAFLPSECSWVFDWVFRTAFPTLLGKESLKRTQLVMSDGDKQIYNAFDGCQQELYPNAKHGLCAYHLVSKQLHERMSSRMLEAWEPASLDMITTFKLWLFSWMQLGGVETDREYEVSYGLFRQWLGNLTESIDPNVKHNARELEVFLVKSILPHKDRWYFPKRIANGMMTFNQKTSSPVESCNTVMKDKASKTVQPNMCLKKSFATQDIQVQNRMDLYHRQTMLSYNCTQLWVQGSGTANDVTKMGESLLQQRLTQLPFYGMRVVDDSHIQVVRLPGTSPAYCADCNPGLGQTCPACSNQSPLPKFRRVRMVSFTSIDFGQRYIVNCTCPLYSTTGIPCQHVAKILPQVQKHHFYVRWHRAYPALYKKEGFEEVTRTFKEMQKERRMIIPSSEYEVIMQCARSPGVQSPEAYFRFEQVPIQNNRHGSVPSDFQCNYPMRAETGDRQVINASQEIYGMGLMSQETFADDSDTEDAEEGENSDEQPQLATNVYTQGNVYKDMVAHIGNFTERFGKDLLMPEAVSSFYSWLSEWNGKMERSNRKQTDDKGTWVSCFSKTDNRQTFVRKRGAGEPRRRKKKRKKTPAKISMDSIM